jgi:hypothetical protein
MAPTVTRSPSELLAGEGASAPGARLAVVGYSMIAFATGVVDWIDAPHVDQFFHQLRLAFDNAQNGNPVDIPASPGLTGWTDAFGLASIVLQILFLIWQYRAARLARQLGYPARHAPGWGVAFWFIPVVQFWMPYQAIRDCLPPGHPTRKTVLQVWVLLLVTSAALPWLAIGSGYDRPLGVAVLVCLAVGEAVMGYRAYRVVTAIGEAHRRAVADPYRPFGS